MRRLIETAKYQNGLNNFHANDLDEKIIMKLSIMNECVLFYWRWK